MSDDATSRKAFATHAAAAQEAAPASDARRATTAGKAIASELLFAGAREVLISHHGLVYRLKQTALGKLILTK